MTGMSGQIRCKMSGYGNRTHARTTASVWDSERLVEVEVAHISADDGRAGEAYLGVHVGPVHVDLAPVLVHNVADLLDCILEDAMS
jgi:hypothetical protein